VIPAEPPVLLGFGGVAAVGPSGPDDVLARWPAVAKALADPTVSFPDAQLDATIFADALHDLLHRHLALEDKDVLPLFWRHYTAAEYDHVFQPAVKKGKKAGMWFVAPFSVDCYAEGPNATPSSPRCRASCACSIGSCAPVRPAGNKGAWADPKCPHVSAALSCLPSTRSEGMAPMRRG
jgi:hypothetical protein